MTKKIFRFIMFATGIILFASIFIIMGCLYDYFGNIQETQLKDGLNLAAAAVEDSGIAYLEHLDSKRYRITWVAADGSVIHDTRNRAAEMENHANRQEIKDALHSGSGESSRYSSTFLEKTIYSAKRLSDGTVLRISISRATIGVLLIGMFQPIAIVLILALILSAILAKRISKRITEPLNRLNLDMPLENDTYEELAPLLGRLNQQQRYILSQMRQLQQQRDEFMQITGNMKEALVLLNSKGTVVSINPTACRLFGTENSCIGKDFLAIERSHEISQAIDTAMRDGHSEIRINRAGRCCQFDISRIESEGAIIGTVLLAFDVTEQEYAERNRQEFTANVSHELKTPLQSIIGSAELIENNLVKSADMPRFIGHIRQEATRLVTLIEDIIRLSQLDEGKDLFMEDIELLELTEEVFVDLNDSASAKKIHLSVNGTKTIFHGVRRLLYEIIYNLCDNAIKYNTENGSVEVIISADDKNVSIAVKDSGIGIPEEHQSRVFERFYRVDKSHSKDSGGTGLGLSIVKHAVAYHGGNTVLQSEPNKGTTITVLFPIA